MAQLCWVGATGCLLKIKEDSNPVPVRSIEEMEKVVGVNLTKEPKRSNREISASPANNEEKRSRNERGKHTK